MGRKKSDDAGAELPKSVLKNLPTGFLEEAEAMDGDQLRGAIIAAETSLRENDQEKAADERLAAAREQVKDLGAAYRDVAKAQKAKIALALHLLAQRGEL